MNENRLYPRQQRLVHLDVLRGFALLGILLVNFEWFARPLQAIVLGAEPGLAGADRVVDWLIAALAEGKFYPLFSMLFGAGFALMAERAEARGSRFGPIYLRRIALLGLFGLAHMLLVWAGDILLVYSLFAFVMVLLFRNTPVSRLWKWSVLFFVAPLLLLWLGALGIWASQFDPEVHSEVMSDFAESSEQARERIDVAARIHAEGGWTENLAQRGRDMAFSLAHLPFWGLPVLGFFLLGRWLVATGRLIRPDEYPDFYRRLAGPGVLLGLALAVSATLLLHEANLMVPTFSVALGASLAAAASVVLSLGYLALVVRRAGQLAFLAPAGQMALTNYLLQSLVWTWLLYGHGAGLGDSITRAAHLPLALVFFAGQAGFSIWWLKRFRFGPAEWLWRSLTYWQAQPMRR